MNKRDFLKSVCLAPIVGMACVAEAKTKVVHGLPQFGRYGDMPFVMKTPPKIDILKLETDFLSLAADNYECLKDYIVVVINDEITEGVTQADCVNGFAMIPRGKEMCLGYCNVKVQILFKSDYHRRLFAREQLNEIRFSEIWSGNLLQGGVSQYCKFHDSKTRIRRILNDKYGKNIVKNDLRIRKLRTA